MTNHLKSWPEPVVRVQHLSDSGIRTIPDCYVKKISDRPKITIEPIIDIPVVDMHDLHSDDVAVREGTMRSIDAACRESGFFQVVNHGVGQELMVRTREVWREFFELPLEEKHKYANSPSTYEGYGSRLGVEKGMSLDWSDYFFLNYLPLHLRDEEKWPSLPGPCRDLVSQYSAQVVELGGKLLHIFSRNLGLEEEYLTRAFGGEQRLGACLRVNYYPKCPQPDLTLGLSSHSDPGGLTLLYPDEDVAGLQVRSSGNGWLTVKPVSGALIINLGDQLQVLSNGIYKSVDHRVIVNSDKDRVSLAMFYNPNGHVIIKPAEQLVAAEEEPPRYPAMKYDEYRMYIRRRGPCGKSQVESLMGKS